MIGMHPSGPKGCAIFFFFFSRWFNASNLLNDVNALFLTFSHVLSETEWEMSIHSILEKIERGFEKSTSMLQPAKEQHGLV